MKSSTAPRSAAESHDETKRAATVDLRSDTVTRPTPAMRRAMAEADVGDDVYGEDPTLNRLEQRAAEIFGREAALFVPTGTMGNQIAIKCHTRPGQEIICEARSHILDYEMAMMAHFSGCIPRALPGEDGILRWSDIKKKIRPKTYYVAQTGLVELENTHNMGGGTVYPTEVAEEICDGAHDAGLPVHLDGARIFNAAAALGKPVAEITRKFDSVMFCLSKGLGAPVGSMVVGSRNLIDQARRYRKALGGGMRQVGVLAAAGILALEQNVGRLAEDHCNAAALEAGLAQIPGLYPEPAPVRTNILYVTVTSQKVSPAELVARLEQRGVLMMALGPRRVRAVTNYHVTADDIPLAVQACREAMA